MPCRSASGSFAKATRYLILQSNETRHGIRARSIHADFAVMIDRHEREGGIDGPVDHVDVEPIDRR